MPQPAIDIRPATPADIPLILRLIRELAEYEKLSHTSKRRRKNSERRCSADKPYAEILIARVKAEPVGQALFFHTYSTFLAKPGIYFEDIFVLPELPRPRRSAKRCSSAIGKIGRRTRLRPG